VSIVHILKDTFLGGKVQAVRFLTFESNRGKLHAAT